MNLQFQVAEPLIAYLVQVYILAPNHSWEDVIVPTHLIRSGKYVEKKLCGLTPMLNVVNKCLQGTAGTWWLNEWGCLKT